MSRYGKKRVSHQSRKQECTRPASSLNRHVEMSWCRDDRRNNLPLPRHRHCSCSSSPAASTFLHTLHTPDATTTAVHIQNGINIYTTDYFTIADRKRQTLDNQQTHLQPECLHHCDQWVPLHALRGCRSHKHRQHLHGLAIAYSDVSISIVITLLKVTAVLTGTTNTTSFAIPTDS